MWYRVSGVPLKGCLSDLTKDDLRGQHSHHCQLSLPRTLAFDSGMNYSLHVQ